MKTKDGYEVYKGMVLSDSTGVYEVRDVSVFIVTVRKILWENEEDP